MFRPFLSKGLAVIYLLGALSLASAAPADPFAQVIEGAKKEGTVSTKLHSSFTEKSMQRLEKEIKEKYGVDLKIKFAPAIQFGTVVTEAMMEQKAGAVPSWELLGLTNQISTLNQAGVVDQVDWKPLLGKGTNPSVVHQSPLMRGGIIYYTGHLGLMYHPEKVKPDEVPKTLAGLADPKWKGKIGLQNGTSSWLRWSYVLGKEKVLSNLRAVMKNGAIQGGYTELLNRYLIGELSMCTISSVMMKDAQAKGMPAAWQSLDFSDVAETALMLVKGAKHPNAAKLVALYLASPEGAKFVMEEAGPGNLYYPGNFEHDIRLLDQKQGIREVFGDSTSDILEFINSKEAAQLDKEIKLVLQGGSDR